MIIFFAGASVVVCYDNDKTIGFSSFTLSSSHDFFLHL